MKKIKRSLLLRILTTIINILGILILILMVSCAFLGRDYIFSGDYEYTEETMDYIDWDKK
ncbi:MAG: hypothetical protein LBU87_05150 [Lactobacillales bacterium]|jgi:hypothetical protein|nr:hypothetical protein [Lactobacillales bacterium]